jgi:hypothetical protein
MRSNGEPVEIAPPPVAHQRQECSDRDSDGNPVWNGPTLAIDRPLMTRGAEHRSRSLRGSTL